MIKKMGAKMQLLCIHSLLSAVNGLLQGHIFLSLSSRNVLTAKGDSQLSLALDTFSEGFKLLKHLNSSVCGVGEKLHPVIGEDVV